MARRRWGRAVLLAGAVAVMAATTVAAALGVFGGGGTGATTAASNLPPATAEVAVTTLVATEEFDGTLGYGDTLPVQAIGGTGIVTWRPGPGSVIERGEPVYSVDAEPVVLLYGGMPFFRNLAPGTTGPDVEQLEENLSELGYQDFTVDGEYTSATASAVSAWQADTGLPETGEFDPATAVVAASAIRVAELLAPLGGTAAGEILSYTGTERQITVELEVTDQQLVEPDLPVTVTLPDGATVAGTVTDVGTVVTGGDVAEGQQEAEPATFEIVITVDDEEALGGWDTAPVEVLLETDRREGVLAVPVGALLALAEGGYGVQAVAGAATRYVAVDTGLFAGGMVEISGAGVAEGMLVGVPAS